MLGTADIADGLANLQARHAGYCCLILQTAHI